MIQFFHRHLPWHPYREPPSGVIALIAWLVGIAGTAGIYLALWVGLSALEDALPSLPFYVGLPLTCVLMAVVPFCIGLLSPSWVAITIPLVGQVAGTLIWFTTPSGDFSSLVYDSLTPLFALFIGVPLFLVYLPFSFGKALR